MLSRVAHGQVLADGVPLEVVCAAPFLPLTAWWTWRWEPELLFWTMRRAGETETGRAPKGSVDL